MNVEMQNPILRNIANLGTMDMRISPPKAENTPFIQTQTIPSQSTALYLPRPPLFSLEQFSAMFSMVIDLFKSFMSMVGEMGFSPPKSPEVTSTTVNHPQISQPVKPTTTEPPRGSGGVETGAAIGKGTSAGDLLKNLFGVIADKIGSLFNADGKKGGGLMSIFGDLFGGVTGLLGGGLLDKGLGSIGGIFKGLKKLF